MSRASTILFVLGGLTFGCVAASAAEVWIETDPRPVDPRRAYEVRLLSGDPGSGTATPVAGGRLQRVWRSGRTFLDLPDSGTARLEPAGPGLQLLAYEADDGRRFAKALVAAGPLKASDPLRWSELGHRLELVPQFDPALLDASGPPVEIQVLFEREPLYGARVEAIAEGGDSVRARTDEIGVARLRLDRSARWLLRVRHDVPAGPGGPGGRHSATLSLVVPVAGGTR